MKKVLSVLLILAALFGFYGGAVNIQDVLAAKSYWEDKSEQTTADLQRLEDGLNQLKENEQAYLDGLVAVEEGEETLKEGEATYEAGVADYEAAPAKLAAARTAIAEGEDTLDEGYSSYNRLKKLIAGLKKAKTSYSDYSIKNGKKGLSWKKGYEKTASKKDYSDAGLRQAREVITKTLSSKSDDISLIESLSGKSGLLKSVKNAKTYAKYDSSLKDVIAAFTSAAKTLKSFADMAAQYANNEDLTTLKNGCNSSEQVEIAADTKVPVSSLTLDQVKSVIAGAKTKINDAETAKKELEDKKSELEAKKSQAEQAHSAGIMDDDTYNQNIAQINAGIAQCEAGIAQYEAGIESGKKNVEKLQSLVDGRATAASMVASFQQQAGDKISMVAKLSPELAQALSSSMQTIAANSGSTKNSDYATALATLQGALSKLSDTLNGKVKEINSNKETLSGWRDGYKQLKDGKDQLADTSEGLPYAFSQMLSNKTIKDALKANAKSLIPYLKTYSGNRLNNDDFPKFNDDMTVIVNKVIPQALKVLNGVKADAAKQLAAGEKTLASGKAQYAQGLADYEAAPAKLDAGLKQLEAGRKTLAEGKAKLAEYEDGEQQVRDGLATLMASERYADLQTILERRNGDDAFDTADKNLDIDDGLSAVGTGREYQTDTGEVVTSELTGRILGSGLEIGAAVVALIAGLLSLLKKYKGAATAAVLTAIVGIGGMIAGSRAGMEMSSIAGSTIGATPTVAAAILAVIAAAFAGVHFAAKKEG